MSVPKNIAEELLIKCARRCCICRRFDPLQLQVHHIVPRDEGGTDDPENLIAICLSCHSDVHTRGGFGRRFTGDELKAHRDALYGLLAEGKLPVEDESPMPYEELCAQIVDALRSRTAGARYAQMELSSDALDMLLRTVKEQGLVYDLSDGISSDTTAEDVRQMAQNKAALEELTGQGLVRYVKGLVYMVTHEGFLLADSILAAGSDRST